MSLQTRRPDRNSTTDFEGKLLFPEMTNLVFSVFDRDKETHALRRKTRASRLIVQIRIKPHREISGDVLHANGARRGGN